MSKLTDCSVALQLTALAVPALLAMACTRQSTPPLSYRADVAPILTKHCTTCHLEGQPGTLASGLQLDSYAALMKGTRFGAVVIPGDPLSSALNMLVEGRADPRIKMPHGGKDPLTAAELKTLRDWVQQGAHDN